MTAYIYYHYPDDPQYSLAYVTQDQDEITAGQNAIIERYELDEEFFVLYTNQGASGTVENLDDDFEDALDEMSPQNRTIAIRLLQIFEEIIEEKELEEDAKLEIYKQIELERIPDAIDRINWDCAAVDVAGQLMSTLYSQACAAQCKSSDIDQYGKVVSRKYRNRILIPGICH